MPTFTVFHTKRSKIKVYCYSLMAAICFAVKLNWEHTCTFT